MVALLHRAAAERLRVLCISLFVALVLVVPGGCDAVSSDKAAPVSKPLIVYSSRNEQLIKPVFEKYTEQTGIPIKFITDSEGPLIQRLTAEGSASPADILMTVDAGNLWFARQQGLLQPISSAVLERAVPSHLRDPQNHWFGLSVRARTIVYHPDRVQESELDSYEGLADPKWRDRLCLRTSKKVYNQSLVAMMMVTHGEARTEAIVRDWVKNLAAPVFSSDTKLIEAIAAGQCDVGIVNTYYLGRKLKKQSDYPVKLFWANQQSDGAHVNISGAGVTAHSRQPERAQAFLEWLATGEAQIEFASVNIEYPVNGEVPSDNVVASWGPFRQQVINVSRAGELQSAAVKLMDRAGYL